MTLDLNDDATRAEYRRVRSRMRLQIAANGRDPHGGRESATTIGAIADACGLTPDRVLEHLTDAWLVILTRSGETREILVEEDGE